MGPSLPKRYAPFHPYVPVIDSMTYDGLDRLDGLAGVIRRHSQIVRVICGHVHRPITAAFAGTIAVSCPSTWCQLAFGGAPVASPTVAPPPAFALHLIEADGAALSHLIPVGDFAPV